jgi:hypothetical protein
MFPFPSHCAHVPEVSVPAAVTNEVVFPLRVPVVGAAPAPPPKTGAFSASAAEEAQAVAELK